jgi:recombination protein RecT
MKELAERTGETAAEQAPKPGLTFPLAMRQQLEGARDQIMAALPSKIDADRFTMVALTAITRNDRLQECGLPSVFLAVMECARTGLYPDGQEAAIIPYKGMAEFQPMAQGITRLMLRSPGLTKVEARAVFEGDVFHFNYGLHPDLVHVPLGTDTAGRKLTHAYAIMWRQGAEPTFEVVDRDVIEAARLTSRAPNGPAWGNPLWYPEMARKVALKRMAKYADLSPEATRAIALDNLVVGGEDWTSAEPEGVSPEYRNQLVRSQTEAGIARLKDKMAGESEANGSVAVSEPNPPPAEEIQHEEPSPVTRQDWPTMFWALANRYELDKEQVNEVLVKHGKNFHHAYEALKASLEPESPQ